MDIYIEERAGIWHSLAYVSWSMDKKWRITHSLWNREFHFYYSLGEAVGRVTHRDFNHASISSQRPFRRDKKYNGVALRRQQQPRFIDRDCDRNALRIAGASLIYTRLRHFDLDGLIAELYNNPRTDDFGGRGMKGITERWGRKGGGAKRTIEIIVRNKFLSRLSAYWLFLLIVNYGSCNHHLRLYEGSLKSFRPNNDTRHFFLIFFLIFLHSLLVTLHTSPSDAPISLTHQNSTRRFSLQNNCSRR